MKMTSGKNNPQRSTWQDFEGEVHDHVQAKLNQYRLMLNPNTAKVYRKKGYFSKDRQKDILFDVVIEGFVPAQSTPSLIWIWECKDYPNRNVGVDEVEEFSSKLQQIGFSSVKGTIVTRMGFDAGAIAYAKSQRIGLAVLHKELHEVTHYDKASEGVAYERLRIACPYILSLSGKEIGDCPGMDLDGLIQIELRNLGLMVPLPSLETGAGPTRPEPLLVGALRLTPGELRKMPREQRQAILASAAEMAEQDYRSDKELTRFEAFGEEELDDDESDSR